MIWTYAVPKQASFVDTRIKYCSLFYGGNPYVIDLFRWLKPLEKLLAEINIKYCDFFKRMGCAGQVTLHKDPVSAIESFLMFLCQFLVFIS